MLTRRRILSLPFLRLAPFTFGRPMPAEYRFHHDNVLGTSMDVILFAPSDREAQDAEAAALEEVDRLCAILSTYSPASEISRLNAAAGSSFRSHDLARVLSAYEHWERRTAGAIAGRLHGREWNVDALGKAFVVDSAARAASNAAPAVSGLLLDIGGDMVVAGGPWSIGIANPFNARENSTPLARLSLTDAAVATSGTYERGPHILDPRTGRAAEGVVSATVIAPDSITANALATALCVISEQEGLRLVAKTPGAECLVIRTDGGVSRSGGFSKYEDRGAVRKILAPGGWPDGYELSIDLTLKNPLGYRVRRPYVAVWAEDSKGTPVRNIAVWAERPKWLPELTTWWSINKASDVHSMTRATRPPGRYRLAWDGLDDKGRPVPPGTYRIIVETNRQHGSYAKENATILCGPKAAAATLKETSEFEAVQIQYGPRGQRA